MSKPKAVLFDVDGVLIVPQMTFKAQYANKYGININGLETFFRGEFSEATRGKADLKDLLRKHNDVWRWSGDPQELLDMWFDAENHVDAALLEVVKQQRAGGVPVYLATTQERYRVAYLRRVMFPNVFDGMFVSCEIGAVKHESAYWASVLEQLRAAIPGIAPGEVVYFDDSQTNVDAAGEAGVAAYLYGGIEKVRRVLEG